MNAKRFFTRVGLVAALLLALIVASLGLWEVWTSEPRKPEWIAVIAASLAVITSVVSSWSAIRFLEIEEDNRRPEVSAIFDAKRRPGLVNFVVANDGGSPARNVRVEWDREPPRRQDGEAFQLPDIPVLRPGDSIAWLVDSPIRMFDMAREEGAPLSYAGAVTYLDDSGKLHRKRFLATIEQYRRTLFFETDRDEMYNKLPKVPDELKELRGEIKRLSRAVEGLALRRKDSDS